MKDEGIGHRAQGTEGISCSSLVNCHLLPACCLLIPDSLLSGSWNDWMFTLRLARDVPSLLGFRDQCLQYIDLLRNSGSSYPLGEPVLFAVRS